MSNVRFCFGLAFVFFISACASTQTRLVEVQRGMDTEAVHNIMGTPKDKTFRGSQELWAYEGEGGKTKLIVFQGGKVVDLLNTDKKNDLHALAPTDVSTSENRKYGCTGKNQFGTFTEGGGCNMYGCWSPGGYCNGFGCSSSGVCNARGCPNKTDSVRCHE